MNCEVCGNDYDKAFTVTLGGRLHTFDSFECAIQALAPACAALRLQGPRPRRRVQRHRFLLRPLRQARRRRRTQGPGLTPRVDRAWRHHPRPT